MVGKKLRYPTDTIVQWFHDIILSCDIQEARLLFFPICDKMAEIQYMKQNTSFIRSNWLQAFYFTLIKQYGTVYYIKQKLTTT